VAAWLNLGAAWFTGSIQAALLPLPALFGLLLGATWWTRWLLGHEWSPIGQRTGITLGWALSTLFLLRLRVYPIGAYGPLNFAWLMGIGTGNRWALVTGLVVLATYLWWRALMTGRTEIDFDDLALRFKIGLGAVVLSLLLAGTAPSQAQISLLAMLGLILPLFFFTGLVALSLARLARLRQQRSASSNPAMNPTRTWLLALSGASAGILALAFGIEQIFSYQALQELAWALQPAWSAITAAFSVVATAVAYAIFFILSPLITSLQGLAKRHGVTPPRAGQPPRIHATSFTIPPIWITAGHWLLIGLGIITALLILWITLRHFTVFRTETVAEEREGLDAASLLRTQLRDLLARLGAWLRPHPHNQTTDGLAGLPSPIRAIRLLYRDLLHTAAAAGLERLPAETPDEFAQRLCQQLPPENPLAAATPPVSGTAAVPRDQGLAVLTSVYTAARYNGPPPDTTTVKLAQQWWAYLRELFRQP